MNLTDASAHVYKMIACTEEDTMSEDFNYSYIFFKNT